MDLTDAQLGLPILDPVQHIRELLDLVGSDVVTDDEIAAHLNEGGPAHAIAKIQEKLGL